MGGLGRPVARKVAGRHEDWFLVDFRVNDVTLTPHYLLEILENMRRLDAERLTAEAVGDAKAARESGRQSAVWGDVKGVMGEFRGHGCELSTVRAGQIAAFKANQRTPEPLLRSCPGRSRWLCSRGATHPGFTP